MFRMCIGTAIGVAITVGAAAIGIIRGAAIIVGAAAIGVTIAVTVGSRLTVSRGMS